MFERSDWAFAPEARRRYRSVPCGAVALLRGQSEIWLITALGDREGVWPWPLVADTEYPDA